MPPRRNNTGAVVAWVIGGVALVAVLALVATLVVTRSGTDDSTAASETAPSSSSSETSRSVPGGSGSEPGSDDPAAESEIRAALLAYISARNARDVQRMRSTVCAQSRDRITDVPPADGGDIVLDGFLDTVIDGNVAQSEVLSHLERSGQRTASEKSNERFRNEAGAWIYCPDAEPDIGA